MLLYYFILCIAAAVLSLLSKNRHFSHLIAGIFLAVQAFTVFKSYASPDTQILDFFTLDGLALLFFALMAIVAIGSYVHSVIFLRDSSLRNWNIFQFGFILLCGCLTGAYLSNHLVVTWIFMEASTLASALLIYHKRNERSLEATWKYIFVCSLGIAIAYFGILFASIMLRGIPDANLRYSGLALQLGIANPLYLKLAFIFLLVGYSCKAEVFPFFSIGVDANQMAPSSVSAFFSTAMTNMGLIAILRIYQLMEASLIFEFVKTAMLLTGIFSLIVAALYTQRSRNYKRIMAYSTVENMGLVFIGLGIGGLGYYAAILHIVVHTFVKSASFFQLGFVGRTYHSYSILYSGSYSKINPVASFVLMLCTLSVMALPPSGLFISELILIKALIISKSWWTLSILAACLCFIMYALGTKVGSLLYNPRFSPKKGSIEVFRNPALLGIQAIFLLACFSVCFYQPQWLRGIVDTLAALL